MKKIIALILALLMLTLCFAFTACDTSDTTHLVRIYRRLAAKIRQMTKSDSDLCQTFEFDIIHAKAQEALLIQGRFCSIFVYFVLSIFVVF